MGELSVAHLCLVLTASTLECVIPQVSDGNQATQVAHMDSVGIGHLKKTLSQELRRAVGDLTITFHLAKTKTTITEMKVSIEILLSHFILMYSFVLCLLIDKARGQNINRGGISLPRSALHGLSVKNLHRSPCPGVNLVIHHMFQPNGRILLRIFRKHFADFL